MSQDNNLSYNDFLTSLQKKGSKPHVIGHCLGTRDAWKWVRKHKWESLNKKPCSSSLYSSIVDAVNQSLVEQFLEGHVIDFPYNMGSLRLSSYPSKVYFKDGKLKNNYRVDWLKTLELWYYDDEARKEHRFIKRLDKDIVSIIYDKSNSNFHNRLFYSFRANRSLVKKVGKANSERKLHVYQLESE